VQIFPLTAEFGCLKSLLYIINYFLFCHVPPVPILPTDRHHARYKFIWLPVGQ